MEVSQLSLTIECADSGYNMLAMIRGRDQNSDLDRWIMQMKSTNMYQWQNLKTFNDPSTICFGGGQIFQHHKHGWTKSVAAYAHHMRVNEGDF